MTSKVVNKVVNVPLAGGILGALGSSPMSRLNNAIKDANAEGWSVVNVIESKSGNLLLTIWRFILLVITLFLYTTSNGFYVIFEKEA